MPKSQAARSTVSSTEIIKLFHKGMKYADIAKRVGMTWKGVESRIRYLRKIGRLPLVRPPIPQSKRLEIIRTVADLHREGLKNVEIQKRTGITQVSHWLRQRWEIGEDPSGPSRNPAKERRILIYQAQVERGEHITFIPGED